MMKVWIVSQSSVHLTLVWPLLNKVENESFPGDELNHDCPHLCLKFFWSKYDTWQTPRKFWCNILEKWDATFLLKILRTQVKDFTSFLTDFNFTRKFVEVNKPIISQNHFLQIFWLEWPEHIGQHDYLSSMNHLKWVFFFKSRQFIFQIYSHGWTYFKKEKSWCVGILLIATFGLTWILKMEGGGKNSK